MSHIYSYDWCNSIRSSSKDALNDSSVFSERELMFMFAICRRPSVCLAVCLSSVTFVHPTQPIEIFGNVSAPFNTLVT